MNGVTGLAREDLERIYELVDSIPFSRPKRNIHRDFSDGCMMAELLHFYFPKMVELHNYPATNSQSAKYNNWETLSSKVLKRLGIPLKRRDIQSIVGCQPNYIEHLLKQIFDRAEQQNNGASSNGHRTEENREEPLQPRLPLAVPENQTEIIELTDKIDQAYLQLQRLQEIARLKDAQIRSLERKLDALL